MVISRIDGLHLFAIRHLRLILRRVTWLGLGAFDRDAFLADFFFRRRLARDVSTDDDALATAFDSSWTRESFYVVSLTMASYFGHESLPHNAQPRSTRALMVRPTILNSIISLPM
jgi:hypothetical protein